MLGLDCWPHVCVIACINYRLLIIWTFGTNHSKLMVIILIVESQSNIKTEQHKNINEVSTETLEVVKLNVSECRNFGKLAEYTADIVGTGSLVGTREKMQNFDSDCCRKWTRDDRVSFTKYQTCFAVGCW